MTLAAGTRIGSYEVISALGAGGMGEVYRARDTKLNRDVAVKVLPTEVATDPERLARFRREAQVLAALNHPHIGHIYGFEDSSDTHALVLELVDGPTLADRIAKGPIPVDEALPIAEQIAEALEAAHEQGIIHRDLKPANIKIAPDGCVKILDFGLAKLVAADTTAAGLTESPTVTGDFTRGTVLLGTVGYMSPEQARGLKVDKRTDIWAFGCVLYEMLTGRRAFSGATVSDSIAKILEREPDWTVLPATLPASVRRVISRCLDKDPKRRLRDIGDVRADLDEAPAETRTVSSGGAAARRLLLVGIAALAALAAAIVAWTGRRAPPDLAGLPASIERMTFDSGVTTMPALSSDGRLLAYASDRGGRNLDIWVQQTVGGAPLRLTDDPADDISPDFSPDGSQIIFRSDRAGGGLFVTPALGGPARLIVPAGRGPKFSPDGSRIAYWTGTFRGAPSGGSSQLFVVPLAGGPSVRLLEEFVVARDPVWSPDGRAVVSFGRRDRTSPPAQSIDWWWVPVDGSNPVKTGVLDLVKVRGASPISTQAPDIEAVPLAWVGDGILFSDVQNLMFVPLSATTHKATGAPRQVTFGTGMYRSASGARDGTLVFEARSAARVVHRAAIDASIENATAADELLTDGQQGAWRASTTRDGSIIAIERAVQSRWEIWTKQIRTGQEQLIISVASAGQTNATIDQEGSRIAYTVTERAGDLGRGFVIETTGGVAKLVCSGCSLHGFLRDNRRVLAIADSGRALRLIDTMSGATDDLVIVDRGQLNRPHASADDRWLAFNDQESAGNRIHVVPLSPGHPVPRDRWERVDEPTTTGRPAGWALNAPILYLLLDADGFRCLWAQRIDPRSGHLVGRPTVVRHFHREQMASAAGVSTSFGNAVSAAGFIYESIAQRSDIWRLIRKNGQAHIPAAASPSNP